MKIDELFPREGKNTKKAKRIRVALKDKAKANNPGETEDRGGWSVDPHQGTYNTLRMAG
jgi:hypothetical protein